MAIFRLTLLFLFAATLPAAPPKDRLSSPAAIAARIKTIRANDVAWRNIAWKSCLLEGLAEARRTGKPLMVWCYIDRPVGDTRC